MTEWGVLGVAAGFGLGALIVAAPAAHATMEIQKGAKAAGVQAANCTHCHVDKLPKKGAATMNDVGSWLVAEKDKRKAEKIDGAWLKDYKAPEKK
jgi:hypothetical protein